MLVNKVFTLRLSFCEKWALGELSSPKSKDYCDQW